MAFPLVKNRKLQPDSNVLRIHVMKGSHASTVMLDTDKYRFVEIPPCSQRTTRCRIDKDSVSTSNATIISKEW